MKKSTRLMIYVDQVPKTLTQWKTRFLKLKNVTRRSKFWALKGQQVVFTWASRAYPHRSTEWSLSECILIDCINSSMVSVLLYKKVPIKSQSLMWRTNGRICSQINKTVAIWMGLTKARTITSKTRQLCTLCPVSENVVKMMKKRPCPWFTTIMT